MRWQVQDVKQRLSEVLRKAEVDGPQFVTRHGEEVAVVIDIVSYRRLAGIGVEVDFKDALTANPHTDDTFAEVLDEVVAERKDSLPRDVELGAGT